MVYIHPIKPIVERMECQTSLVYVEDEIATL